MSNKVAQSDPAEGSREVIDRELARSDGHEASQRQRQGTRDARPSGLAARVLQLLREAEVARTGAGRQER